MQALVELRSVSKRFGGVQALDGVSFPIGRGQIHGLVGENGAGKSTLIKILGGVYQADGGDIRFDGRPLLAHSPAEALRLGIATVHQEIPLCPNLSVAQNVFLRNPVTTRWGRADWRAMEARTRELFARIGQRVDPRQRVGGLSIAGQQLTAIVQALRQDCRLLILDEPTAALTPGEVDNLFAVLRQLRAEGRTILFVSHILGEVFAITDTITVLRNGGHVATRPTAELTVRDVVQLMVGAVADEGRPARGRAAGEDVLLRVEGLHQRELGLADISFELHRQEILGIAGIQGAGRTELALCLFGAYPPTAGRLVLAGREVRMGSPAEAIRLGIGYLTEDRRRLGLFWNLDVKHNMAAAVIDRLKTFLGMVDRGRLRQWGWSGVRQLGIRTPSLEQAVPFLSGGNQQKALLARWLNVRPSVLILDEPTRGVDVGAKAEIRRVIRRLVGEGISVIVISSDLEELLLLSDRIVVMAGRRVQGTLRAGEATKESVMALATVR